jgi:hypothetical protein
LAGVHGMSGIPRVSTTGILKGIALPPGQSRGNMTLRDCKEGIGLNVSSRPLGRIGQSYGLGWRPYMLVALLAAAPLFCEAH